MEWLDAMRGCTMLLVVAYHVATMGMGIVEKTSSSLSLLALFRMPLFFFVSGFLAYKADMAWTTGRLGMAMWKKVKIQMIPTAVFFCAFIVIRKPHFWPALMGALQSPTKGGYWFTWALLVMFIAYYLFAFLEQKLRWGGRAVFVLWGAALCLYEWAYLPKLFTFPHEGFMKASSLLEVCYFAHWFFFGNIVRRHWERAERLFDSRWLFPLLVGVAFVGCADYFRWHTLRMGWANLPRTLAMYSLVLVVVMTFRHYRDFFSQRTRVGRGLQYVGVRTLDIYLIHYIVLPKMGGVGALFNENRPNVVLETALSVAVGLLVVAFCCGVSHVLRVSPFLKKHLFGRR